jgi:hypothetical protein
MRKTIADCQTTAEKMEEMHFEINSLRYRRTGNGSLKTHFTIKQQTIKQHSATAGDGYHTGIQEIRHHHRSENKKHETQFLTQEACDTTHDLEQPPEDGSNSCTDIFSGSKQGISQPAIPLRKKNIR